MGGVRRKYSRIRVESESSDEEISTLQKCQGNKGAEMEKLDASTILKEVQRIITLDCGVPFTMQNKDEIESYKKRRAHSDEEKILILYQMFSVGKGAQLAKRLKLKLKTNSRCWSSCPAHSPAKDSTDPGSVTELKSINQCEDGDSDDSEFSLEDVFANIESSDDINNNPIPEATSGSDLLLSKTSSATVEGSNCNSLNKHSLQQISGTKTEAITQEFLEGNICSGAVLQEHSTQAITPKTEIIYPEYNRAEKNPLSKVGIHEDEANVDTTATLPYMDTRLAPNMVSLLPTTFQEQTTPPKTSLAPTGLTPAPAAINPLGTDASHNMTDDSMQELVEDPMSASQEQAPACQCPICYKTLVDLEALSRHIRRVHENERKYGCEYCEYRSFTSYEVECHKRDCHTGLHPHNCENCGKGFNKKSYLLKHMEKYAGGPCPPDKSLWKTWRPSQGSHHTDIQSHVSANIERTASKYLDIEQSDQLVSWTTRDRLQHSTEQEPEARTHIDAANWHASAGNSAENNSQISESTFPHVSSMRDVLLHSQSVGSQAISSTAKFIVQDESNIFVSHVRMNEVTSQLKSVDLDQFDSSSPTRMEMIKLETAMVEPKIEVHKAYKCNLQKIEVPTTSKCNLQKREGLESRKSNGIRRTKKVSVKSSTERRKRASSHNDERMKNKKKKAKYDDIAWNRTLIRISLPDYAKPTFQTGNYMDPRTYRERSCFSETSADCKSSKLQKKKEMLIPLERRREEHKIQSPSHNNDGKALPTTMSNESKMASESNTTPSLFTDPDNAEQDNHMDVATAAHTLTSTEAASPNSVPTSTQPTLSPPIQNSTSLSELMNTTLLSECSVSTYSQIKSSIPPQNATEKSKLTNNICNFLLPSHVNPRLSKPTETGLVYSASCQIRSPLNVSVQDAATGVVKQCNTLPSAKADIDQTPPVNTHTHASPSTNAVTCSTPFHNTVTAVLPSQSVCTQVMSSRSVHDMATNSSSTPSTLTNSGTQSGSKTSTWGEVVQNERRCVNKSATYNLPENPGRKEENTHIADVTTLNQQPQVHHQHDVNNGMLRSEKINNQQQKSKQDIGQNKNKGVSTGNEILNFPKLNANKKNTITNMISSKPSGKLLLVNFSTTSVSGEIKTNLTKNQKSRLARTRKAAAKRAIQNRISYIPFDSNSLLNQYHGHIPIRNERVQNGIDRENGNINRYLDGRHQCLACKQRFTTRGEMWHHLIKLQHLRPKRQWYNTSTSNYPH